jgi:hypothetical protein
VAGLHGQEFLFAFTLCFHRVSLPAQPAAGSIAVHPLPLAGSIVDAAGNAYSTRRANATSGVTPGAAQTQAGGGTCLLDHRLIGQTSGPCPDGYVAKADGASYVFVVGTTGGSFPTTANAAIATSASSQVFVAKLSADGTRLVYSTHLPDTAATDAAGY